MTEKLLKELSFLRFTLEGIASVTDNPLHVIALNALEMAKRIRDEA